MNYVKIMKIAVGAAVSIILAERLGLNYSASAGVITLLSIQDTKKETIRVVGRRLFSFGLALALAAGSFSIFGYDALALGVFLLFFSAACFQLRMQEGISVNTVLMTHFLGERSMSAVNMGNELALLLVGAGVGVILNLYIPGKVRQIKIRQRRIESSMKEILSALAQMLSESGYQGALQQCMDKLDKELRQGEKNAYEEMENKLLTETRYYIRYMNMRRVQASILSGIAASAARLRKLPPQAEQIAGLMNQISASFHEYNNAVELLGELEKVKQSMREQPLPSERTEFENRAVLFQILLELEQLLAMKREFVEELTADEIGKFWGADGDSEGRAAGVFDRNQ